MRTAAFTFSPTFTVTISPPRIKASAALKFALNLNLSAVGERVVRLIRERLYANSVAAAAIPAPDLPKRGTLVTMLSAEAETVGSFAGAAIAAPLL